MMKKKFSLSVLCATLLLLSYSCIEGFKDETTYDPGVFNTQLQSPDKDLITVKASADGTSATVTWPVVPGAGGYDVVIYNADDPSDPMLIDETDNIDAVSYTFDVQEDTKYIVSVKTLGNQKYNNSDAEEASVVPFSTLVPTYEVIPNGTDLTTYFAGIDIPDSWTYEGDEYDEFAFELVADGNYTASDIVEFGKNKITFRGDKISHPTVTMASGSALSTTAGLKVKFIDFDCSAQSDSNDALLIFSENPDESIADENDRYIIQDPIGFFSCNIKNVKNRLIFDRNLTYVPLGFYMQDCVVELNTTRQAIYMQGGWFNSLYFTNSTIWNTELQQYFIQQNNNARGDRSGYSVTVSYSNNTFYGVARHASGQWYNGGFNHATTTLVVQENIFLDCGGANGGQLTRYIGFNGANPTKVWARNCYWYDSNMGIDGIGVGGEEPHSNGDTSGTQIEVDPQLANPQQGNFTVGNQQIINLRLGDPRWLPAVEE